MADKQTIPLGVGRKVACDQNKEERKEETVQKVILGAK